MVSFTCHCCQDVVKKPKVAGHAGSCGGPNSVFSCVDCMLEFDLHTIKDHTTCVTEVQKYQGQWLQKNKPLRAVPVHPPRPAMNDLSDSDEDDDWVRSSSKPKTEAPSAARQPAAEKEQGAEASRKRGRSRSPVTTAAKDCYVPSFLLGRSNEICDVASGLLRDAGVTHMPLKKLSTELVACYTKRISKQVRHALEEALACRHGIQVNEDGEAELQHLVLVPVCVLLLGLAESLRLRSIALKSQVSFFLSTAVPGLYTILHSLVAISYIPGCIRLLDHIESAEQCTNAQYRIFLVCGFLWFLFYYFFYLLQSIIIIVVIVVALCVFALCGYCIHHTRIFVYKTSFFNTNGANGSATSLTAVCRGGFSLHFFPAGPIWMVRTTFEQITPYWPLQGKSFRTRRPLWGTSPSHSTAHSMNRNGDHHASSTNRTSINNHRIFHFLFLGLMAIFMSSYGTYVVFGLYLQLLYRFRIMNIVDVFVVGTAAGLGFAALAGFLLDYVGHRVTIGYATLICFFGMLFMGLTFDGYFDVTEPTMDGLFFLMNAGGYAVDVVAIITSVTHFPRNRGMVCGLYKSLGGLGASFFSCLFRGYLKSSLPKMFYLYCIVTAVLVIIVLIFYAPAPWVNFRFHRTVRVLRANPSTVLDPSQLNEIRSRMAEYFNLKVPFMKYHIPQRRIRITFLVLMLLNMFMTAQILLIAYKEITSRGILDLFSTIAVVITLFLSVLAWPFDCLDEKMDYTEDNVDMDKNGNPIITTRANGNPQNTIRRRTQWISPFLRSVVQHHRQEGLRTDICFLLFILNMVAGVSALYLRDRYERKICAMSKHWTELLHLSCSTVMEGWFVHVFVFFFCCCWGGEGCWSRRISHFVVSVMVVGSVGNPMPHCSWMQDAKRSCDKDRERSYTFLVEKV
eukprot:gene746-394_t